MRYFSKTFLKGSSSPGVAMGIAGSSRPANGAEHEISHGLDKLLQNRGLHDTQAGIATIFSLCLGGSDGCRDIKGKDKKLLSDVYDEVYRV